MSDEPLLKKKFWRWFGGNKGEDVQRTALEAGGRLPTELTKILNDDHHSTPVLLRKLQGAIKREHLKVDTAVLEGYARKINAGKNVIDAITALRTSAHGSAHLDLHLDRGEELAEAEHQTTVLKKEVERAKLHGELDEQETLRDKRKLERDRIRRRAAAAAVGEDFAERLLRAIEKAEDVMVGYAEALREVTARTDITEEQKQDAIEWLKDLTAKEVRRRLDDEQTST